MLSFLFISSLQYVHFFLFCWINAIVSSARTFNFGLVGVGNNKNDNKTIFQSTLSWLVGDCFFFQFARVFSSCLFQASFLLWKKSRILLYRTREISNTNTVVFEIDGEGNEESPTMAFSFDASGLHTSALSSNISNITYITFNFQPFVSRTLFPLFAEPLAAARNTQCYCKSIFVCIAYTHTHTLYT